jgi:uncharacterized membrane protein
MQTLEKQKNSNANLNLGSILPDSITFNTAVAVVLPKPSEKIIDGIPSPEILRELKAIDPMIVSKIMEMAEKEQLHRHHTDKEWMKKSFRIKYIGQFSGIITITLTLGASVFLATKGFQIAASIFGTVGVAGLICPFLMQKLPDRNNKEK